MFRLYNATRSAQLGLQANSIRSRATLVRLLHCSLIRQFAGTSVPKEVVPDPQTAGLPKTLENLSPAKEKQEGLQREERRGKDDPILNSKPRTRRKLLKEVPSTPDGSEPESKPRAKISRTKAQKVADDTAIDPKPRAPRTRKKAQEREDKTPKNSIARTSKKKASERVANAETKCPAQVTTKVASEGEHGFPHDETKQNRMRKQYFQNSSIVLTNNDLDQLNRIAANIRRKEADSKTQEKATEASSTTTEPRSRPDIDDRKPRLNGVELAQMPEDPAKHVSQYLQWGMARNRRQGRIAADNKRMNIVGEEACNDIVERLKPSLEKLRGCDIIDISPGAGVWSKKVHEMLKPRTHILLEPDTVYRPLLEPLVDTPGSTYKLIPKSGLVWAHLENVMSSGVLPFQVPLEQNDPRLNEPNNTLLVLANIAYNPKKAFKGFASITQMVMYQFVDTIRTHALFQRFGLVRMLVWVNDDEKRYLGLGRSVAYRRKAAIEAGIACEKFEEVASSCNNTSIWGRESMVELASARRVVEKMERNGIKVPVGRESELMKQVARNETIDHSLLDRGFTHTDQYARRLEVLTRAFESGVMEKMDDGVLLYNQMQNMKHQKITGENAYRKMFEIAGQYEKIIATQKKLLEAPDAKGAERRKNGLDRRVKAWERAFAALGADCREDLKNNIENRIAMSSDPPLLLWDRRECEPLKLHPHEFWPQKEMCLIDIQPKAMWPVLRDNRENQDILEYLLGSFFTMSAQSVKHALMGLVPGAYEWLSEECKTLKDVRKGGNPDLDKLSVRVLTDEMLQDMVEAWTRWPWKPSRYEIMSRMGASSYDPDGDTDEFLGCAGI
ncbi:hypothetical protein BUE80_DR011908 [Diplocarpon rosae]|nr:hypothetical protein BUE80_DR011908 [Diplocarpon rosae]